MMNARLTPLIVRAGNRDVGVAPWITRAAGAARTVNRVPFPYLGPLVPPHLLPDTLAELRARGLRRGALLQEAQFMPTSQLQPEELRGVGFDSEQYCTWVVDTTKTEDEAYAALPSRTRQKLRQGQRAGLELTTSGDKATTLRRFLDEVTSRRGFRADYTGPLPPTLEQLDDATFTTRWTLARLNGQEVGSLVTLRSGDLAIGWIGGVLREHQRSHANVALVWDSILWAGREGAAVLDMLGSPSPGIAEFKRQFNAVRLSYTGLVTYAPGAEWLQTRRRRRQETDPVSSPCP